jgi:hypothetical protein
MENDGEVEADLISHPVKIVEATQNSTNWLVVKATYEDR